MREYLIRLLGGHPDVASAIETLKPADKHLVLTAAIQKNFNIISKDELLQKKGGQWFFAGRKLSQEEMDVIRAQAKALRQQILYRVFEADIQYNCILKMKQSTTVDGLTEAKMAEYVWSIIKERLLEL